MIAEDRESEVLRATREVFFLKCHIRDISLGRTKSVTDERTDHGAEITVLRVAQYTFIHM